MARAPFMLGLAATLVLEVVLFAQVFGQFFCGDSVFWFSRSLGGFADLAARFRAIDDLGQYRPLTFVLSSWVIYPLAGLDPVRNHVFPFLFHAANTVWVFLLARRVLRSATAVSAGTWQPLAAAYIFGVSTVAAYVTYDNTFIPDYLYSFFYLAALAALVSCGPGRAPGRLALAHVLFAAALFSKEAAVTFPAAAVILLVLTGGESSPRARIGAAVRRAAPFAGVVLAYFAWHLVLKDGRLYPADPGQPHHIDIGWQNLRAKLAMIAQGIGLPTHLALEPEWLAPLLAALIIPFLVWTAFCAARGIARLDSVYCGGTAWFAATLAPALFVRAPTWEHNLYLPLAGFAWMAARAFGEALEQLEAAGAPRLQLPAAAALAVVLALGAAAHGAAVRRSSWMAAGSRITSDCLADLRRIRPSLEPNTLLYVEAQTPENVAWHFDGGRLAATFYRDPSIRMRFAGDGRPAPGAAMLATRKVAVLKYVAGRLYDTTERRLGELIDRESYRLREHWRQGSVEIAGGPRAAARDAAAGVLFPSAAGIGDDGRDTLALAAGATYFHPLPALARGSQLRLGVALAGGKGLGAELGVRGPSGRAARFARQLRAGAGWEDATLDLSGLEGPGCVLWLRAAPLDGAAAAAGRLEWGPLEIVPPASQSIRLPPPTVPPQPSGIRITPSPMPRGGWATIEVAGGAEMELDCRYLLDTETSAPRTVVSWVTTDSSGRQQLQVNRPGRYTILTIRNALRSDWVTVNYVWVCLP